MGNGIAHTFAQFGFQVNLIDISKENLHKLTEPFYQADKTAATKGFGLGLTICKKIIESHKGKLRIESEKEKGSCFILQLPKNL